jgi:apolipoprotein N-acyltransferase
MASPLRRVDWTPLAAAAASGVLVALAFPLVVPWVGLREVDPAGRLELLAWVALVPAILSVGRAGSWKGAFARGLVAGLACFYAAIHWVSHAMTAFGGLSQALSLFALTLLVLFMAAHWGAAFAVAWTLRARLGWPMHAHLPAVWVALELCRNYLFSGFPWANLGYSQVRTLPIAQLAALAGPYGIAALVVLVNAVLADALAARREQRPLPWRGAVAAAALLVAALVHGEVRLRAVRERAAAAPRITVGIVQPNIDQSVKNKARDRAEYILSRLVPLTVEADRRGADLVAWPEASYPLYLRPGTRSLAASGSGVPPLGRAHLLMGAATVEWVGGADGARVPRVGNVDVLLSPALDVLGVYQKHHLVPFGEYVPLGEYLTFLKQIVPSFAPSIPGSELRVLEFSAPTTTATPTAAANPTAAATPTATPTAPRPQGAPSKEAASPQDQISSPPLRGGEGGLGGTVRLAPMICFDAIFPEINVAFARKEPEPEILVNPTNDAWYGYSSGPYQFLAIVRMRAIEASKAVVRPAYAGVSAVILPTGELAPGALEVGTVDPERAPDPAEPPRLLLAEVPRLRGLTLYTRFGDLFAWACAVAAAAALAAAARKGRRGAKARES